jgi:hypothetical protein
MMSRNMIVEDVRRSGGRVEIDVYDLETNERSTLDMVSR